MNLTAQSVFVLTPKFEKRSYTSLRTRIVAT